MKDKFGLRPLKKDSRDISLGFIYSLPKLEDLPLEFEIPPFEIIDQKDNDFCSAATMAGQKAIMEKKRIFYPVLFAISKQISGDLEAWGQNLRDANKATTISAPLWEDVPDYILKKYEERDWDFLRDIKNYPQDFIDKGKPYRNKAYAKVWHPKYDAFDTMRASLWKFKDEKRTVSFGVVFSWLLEQYELTGTEYNGFGHAMFSNGFKMTDGGIVINSYGTKAGKDGKHLISRRTINFFAKKFGMYMPIDMDKETAKLNNSRAEWHFTHPFLKPILYIKRLWR